MKIGFQVSSIKDHLSTPQDVMTSFQKIKDIGYNEVQIQYVPSNITAADIQTALQENNLVCIGTQDDYPDSLKNIHGLIQKNDVWSSSYICSALWPMDCVNADSKTLNVERYRDFIHEMDTACKLVQDAGKIFTYHPLFFDFNTVDGIVPVDCLLEQVKGLQVTLDLYHVIAAGLDPVETIRKYSGNMDIVHFKDSKLVDGEQVLMPLGQGDTDWKPIVQACVEAGVQYCFIEQEKWQKDAFECMADSFAHIQSLL